MANNSLIIFDIGGTIRDSSLALEEGYKRGFAAFGLDYNLKTEDSWHLRGLSAYNDGPDCMRALFAMAKSGKDLGEVLANEDAEARLGAICSQNVTDEDAKKVREMHGIYLDFFNSPEAKRLVSTHPYMRDTVELLKKSGHTLALFTNANRVTIERDLGDIGLDNFSLIFSEENVNQKKPSGEGITRIMEILGYPPERTFYVGDAVSDVQAARNAGCKAVAVLCGMGLEPHIRNSNPDYVFDNVWQMSEYFAQQNAKISVKE